MKACVDIDAGVCGFHTRAAVLCADGQNVSAFETASDCEKIQGLARALAALTPLDAYMEISPAAGSRLLTCCRDTLKGCCSGCAVPVGLFKAMQVAAGLALPMDVRISVKKEEGVT